MYQVEIVQATIVTPELLQSLMELNQAIPEFDNAYPMTEYQTRLSDKPMLALFIKVEGEVAGFKLGYERDNGQFYSWLGGILPEFRGLGLAKQLLQTQERWAKEQGYHQIEVKTLNRFTSMLKMLISNQYQITNLKQDTDKLELNKISLQKSLVA
ncbi:GNAT family N-acetyltransferase [Shewanella woodyi]|uniref:GCN5-related N-acetyltransferase n=1 Tax=Shewanella woodyi (strain ATCC 51908 / MS32) TaxID=392500 RepID=B1KL50_SHEWM|nr:GNAT family N-acetyltransferase [Shewanella woodyi]ACA84391.1 GCN5-related N-acetyltransferase [Shewanella woodyi ATCC 51908]